MGDIALGSVYNRLPVAGDLTVCTLARLRRACSRITELGLRTCTMSPVLNPKLFSADSRESLFA